MKKILITIAIASLTFVGLATPANATHQPTHFTGKVTICHSTSSETNPYVRINVSVNALKNSGHGTVNLEVALAEIGALNPGLDLTAFVDIGGHDGDIFLLDPDNDVPCPSTPDVPLVSVDLCVDAEAVTVGPSFQADVDAVVAELVAAGATVGDCPEPVVPVTPEEPVVPVVEPAPPVVVVESTPLAPLTAPAPVTAPVAAPAGLPRTGSSSNVLAALGGLLALAGVALLGARKLIRA